MEVKRLTKEEAVNFLKRVLIIEHKYEFVKTQDLFAHPIIDQWEKMNFEDAFPFEISRNLSAKKNLNDYSREVSQKLYKQREDNGLKFTSKTHPKVLTEALVALYRKQVKESHCKLHKEHMVQCPHCREASELKDD